MSKTIRNAIFENPKLKPHEAVIDKENIVIPGLPEGKRPVRSIIENVQHHHTHESDGHEITDILRINEISKPFLNETSKAKRKRFYKWALDRINNHNDIFICSNESWHEVWGPLHKKGRISVQRGEKGYEHAVYEKSAKFSLMQWGAMTTKAQIGLQKIWEPEMKEEKKKNDVILKVINENIVDEVQKTGVKPLSMVHQSINCYKQRTRRLIYRMDSTERQVWEG